MAGTKHKLSLRIECVEEGILRKNIKRWKKKKQKYRFHLTLYNIL